ncbi:hypothetical protein [Pseudoalteromonas denitrificans]|uniref:AAA domain-containing protein n=1 Tax=Pseudoalteromonas denitrificans DSM 6059 TaxID=1123010 RepID=A0A1I1PT15_9GAMM|nr:hypothetical protein [Pseudoalteromonas denitrificans]SFD10113.1 hypothetical protein SAMN02745724_03492 [Pseudoalteromonas denitrificans DSM 6059]
MPNKNEEILTAKGSEAQKKYDKRSHEERILALRDALSDLKYEALIQNKKTIASAAQVLDRARVPKTYFYSRTALKDKDILKRYTDVRDEINHFQENFDELSEDSPLIKLQKKLNIFEERLANISAQLQQSRVDNISLQNRLEHNKSKLQEQEDVHLEKIAIDVAHAGKTSNIIHFSAPIIISPDQYLIKNNRYYFDDVNLRNKAWKKTKNELKQALNRKVPTRVYMLMGSPCAGKTEWSKRSDVYSQDRHAVVIDATNLTRYDRLEWFEIINLYVQNSDIRICAVIFDTDEYQLLYRNESRESDKKMDDKLIIEKLEKFEWPDLQTEMFDEVEMVRYEQ